VDSQIDLGARIADIVQIVGVTTDTEGRLVVLDSWSGLYALDGDDTVSIGTGEELIPTDGVDGRPFTDVASLEDGTFAVTVQSNGLLFDATSKTTEQHFCYEPGNEEWLEQYQITDSLAFDGTDIFAQPQTIKRIGVSNAVRSVPRAADLRSESRESVAGADSARADSAVVPRAPPNRARAHPVVAHDRTHSGVLRLRRIRRGCQAGLGRPRCRGRPGCATWRAARAPIR
jgi:hypothetical protein